jgi:hypothetical protein
MPITDAAEYFHGCGGSTFGPVTYTAATGYSGDSVNWAGPLGTNATGGTAGAQYCTNEIDFGTYASGAAFPYIPAFPSLNEKAETNPPEVVGMGGVEEGVHFIIGQPFTNGGSGFTGITFSVRTSANTNATTEIASRTLTLAQLAVSGAHYYIPVNKADVLEFLRWYATPGTGNPAAGTLVSWWGPRTGAEQ